MGAAVRLLPYAVADGPHNMAADEVLLGSALAGTTSLRFYGWSTATASLGYFQSAQVLGSDPLLRSLPFVRRPSGGATLVHHHEVTYGLALPPGEPWQSGPAWLPRMHAIIAGALGRLGVTGQLHSRPAPGRFGGVLCFQHFTPGDLLVGTAKVVGSAQRKHRGALIQHGGILLARSPFAPALPGVRELAGRDLTPEEVAAAVAAEYTRHTGWPVVPGDWTPAERAAIEEVAAAKYGQDWWNRKR